MIRWWIDLWDREEPATALAALRVSISAALLLDLLTVGRLGLVQLLWSPKEGGGLLNPLARDAVPLLYQWLPPEPWAATAIHVAFCVLALAFGAGLFTRLSGLLLVLLYAQVAALFPFGDRGIDLLLRNALVILLFSRCGAAWSLDALRRTGSLRGDGAPVPAWPRHLLILQLSVVYFMAGVQKIAPSWWPMGGFEALYLVYQNPAVSRWPFEWVASWAPVTRLATAATLLFEWSAWILPLLYWFRATRERPGRLRAWANRLKLRSAWVFVGVLLHLGIALTMQLGLFPYGMLALYPAFFHPDELAALSRRLFG